ncbi:MAG: YggT family protein [Candidatus Cloacimonetes bacterium]|nr:YggT family protein [Candidatus Cloacimonadota bacterium]
MGSELKYLIVLLFQILQWILLARVIFSWIPVSPGDALAGVKEALYEITEPLCAPFRAILPPIGGIDFSIILVFLCLDLFRGTVLSILSS